VWGYAPAHTTTTLHDPPHATIPPRDTTQRLTFVGNQRTSVLRALFVILKI
jgi:hypothetical protein